MSRILVGPTGNCIIGHVLDSSRSPLEAKLRDYDPQLYLRWNAKKLRGWGCWQLMRRSETKSIVDWAELDGHTYLRMEYTPGDHIFDVPFLNYNLLERLKKGDTWRYGYKGKNFASELEYMEAKQAENLEEKSEAEKDYMIKQHKSQIRGFMDYVNNGGNPYAIADVWNKS